MSERRAKQLRRLDRIAKTGCPERHKARGRTLGEPVKWDSWLADVERADEHRRKDRPVRKRRTITPWDFGAARPYRRTR